MMPICARSIVSATSEVLPWIYTRGDSTEGIDASRRSPLCSRLKGYDVRIQGTRDGGTSDERPAVAIRWRWSR